MTGTNRTIYGFNNVLYALVDGNIWEYNSGSQTWTELSGPSGVTKLFYTNGTMYAATATGLYK